MIAQTPLPSICGDDEVYIDVPEPKRSFAEFLARQAFTPGFETAGMYRGALTSLSVVFGVTSLEHL